ncbi:zinc finger Y-chromosomal protein-like [Ostrinia furnacalis]|uniref:zinc finger Y-chromosomal protein-like n=1 Tax=Ostrinia furnacalis TaxID=93504 RepID=UPI00103A7483|nr:zinc finger Y-chromosomal protein-like [Ostrinia furnacalis]
MPPMPPILNCRTDIVAQMLIEPTEGRAFELNSPSSGGLSICSRHFLDEEWECVRGRVRLKRAVVPSLFDDVEKEANKSPDPTEAVPNIDKNHEDKEKTKENENTQKDPTKDSKDPEKETESEEEKSDKEKDKEETSLLSNGSDERVQDDSKGKEIRSSKSVNSRTSSDKCKESTPKLPSGPRDIDKDKVEDIEDLLTYYHIKQNNIHQTDDVTARDGTAEDRDGTGSNRNGTGINRNGTGFNREQTEVEQIEIEVEPIQAESDPVFIEISVDKDRPAGGDTGDCLMVLESVQVDIDPSALLPDPDAPVEDDAMDAMEPMETVEIDDAPSEKHDPISLLTSSDEDDVIIQEPHIDTVEVSDETDEDDMPLVKLLKKRRAEKKKKNLEKKKLDKRRSDTIAQITWGLYEYYCVQCHFKTTNAAEYRRHMAAHAKVILMCQLCGYMTASSSQFAKHEKQHGEKTLYKCHLCDYRTKRNINLAYHMKSHKPKDVCNFVDENKLLVESKLCDDKKYKCNKCEYATKKRSDLKRHKSKKHMEDSDNDEDYVPPRVF